MSLPLQTFFILIILTFCQSLVDESGLKKHTFEYPSPHTFNAVEELDHFLLPRHAQAPEFSVLGMLYPASPTPPNLRSGVPISDFNLYKEVKLSPSLFLEQFFVFVVIVPHNTNLYMCCYKLLRTGIIYFGEFAVSTSTPTAGPMS